MKKTEEEKKPTVSKLFDELRALLSEFWLLSTVVVKLSAIDDVRCLFDRIVFT